MQDADTSAAADSGTSFDAAFSAPEPAAAPGQDGGDGADGGQPRDDHGRFAAKAQAEADAAAAAGKDQGEDRDGGQIPSWRLREIREERDALKAERDAVAAEKAEYERELAVLRRQQMLQRQLQEAPQRPDLYGDPDAVYGYVEDQIGGRVKTIEQQIQDRFVDMTFEAQADVLGKEVFDPMVEAFIATAGVGGSRDPQLFQSVTKASNPGAALVRWHKRHSAMSAVGDDLDGYLKRKQDEWAKDPEVRKRILAELDAEARGGAPAGRSDTITALPSLNRAPGSAGGQRPGSLGDTGEERFENAFGRRKRA